MMIYGAVNVYTIFFSRVCIEMGVLYSNQFSLIFFVERDTWILHLIWIVFCVLCVLCCLYILCYATIFCVTTTSEDRFWGAFGKLRKAIISFVLIVRLHGTTRLPLPEFHQI